MALAAQAALLDELMGRNRNNLESLCKEPHWNDDDVCKYFLCGICPHGLFINTKADLGPCEKTHDERLVEKYKKSSRYKKMGYEQDLDQLLSQLIADVERRIWKGEERLRQNGPTLNGGFHEERKKKLDEVTAKINDLVSKAEQLGSEGKVMESQDLLKQTEEMMYEQNFYQKEIEIYNQQSKELEVCKICGAFRIVDDAPQRVEEHLAGKMHIGYSEVREFIKADKERQKARSKSSSRRRGMSRDKSDKNSDRDRDKVRHRTREDRDRSVRRERSRSNDRHSHKSTRRSHRR